MSDPIRINAKEVARRFLEHVDQDQKFEDYTKKHIKELEEIVTEQNRTILIFATAIRQLQILELERNPTFDAKEIYDT